jgi:hypothetical protein
MRGLFRHPLSRERVPSAIRCRLLRLPKRVASSFQDPELRSHFSTFSKSNAGSRNSDCRYAVLGDKSRRRVIALAADLDEWPSHSRSASDQIHNYSSLPPLAVHAGKRVHSISERSGGDSLQTEVVTACPKQRRTIYRSATVEHQPSVCDLLNLALCLARFSFFLAVLASANLSTKRSRVAWCSGLGCVFRGNSFCSDGSAIVVSIFIFS